ncbi:hypothetical protein QBC45DRAFT_423602 [Copromyces sp. CBS 386.78]|nr:hypothetical protein QBC45DRAFT_423602 [Copromyces sp. CBS 386.78]
MILYQKATGEYGTLGTLFVSLLGIPARLSVLFTSYVFRSSILYISLSALLFSSLFLSAQNTK